MFQYLAFLWDKSADAQGASVHALSQVLRSTTPEWRCALDLPGIKVYCTGAGRGSCGAHVLAGDRGVVLGALFPNTQGAARAPTNRTFSDKESCDIISSHGKDLVERYWGRYVAFLRDPDTGRKWVLRSPTGELDCLMINQGGVHLYMSSLQSWSMLHTVRLSINWEYIAAELCVPLGKLRETGLHEVSRVVHGECVEHHGAHIERHMYWEPAHQALGSEIEDPSAAAEALLQTTSRCIHAWASCYDSILELLSGGLDSSIVLSCLADAPSAPTIACLNYFSPIELRTDERHFARIMANRFGYQLVEREAHLNFTFSGALRVPPMACPTNNIFALSPDHVTSKLIPDVNARAVFSGRGGDQLFYQNGAVFAAADFLRARGLTREVLEFLMSAARLEGDSFWRLAWRSLIEHPKSRLGQTLTTNGLVTRDAITSVAAGKRFLHPWLENCDSIPRGRWWHIFLLSTAAGDDMYDPLATGDAPESVTPLISQPLVELCLRIPTYRLMEGGVDRGFVRRVFGELLPNEISQRTAKGTAYDSAKNLLMHNMGFVRELLLDGMLARQHLLDRRKLEQSLSRSGFRGRGPATKILCYAAVELWLQSWARSEQRAAA